MDSEGAAKSNRTSEEIKTIDAPYVIIGRRTNEIETNRNKARREISFYASTPSYLCVFEHHGWEDIGEKLRRLSQNKQFDKATELVTEEMIGTLAVQAPLDALGKELKTQYGNSVDCLYLSVDFDGEEHWHDVVKTLQNQDL